MLTYSTVIFILVTTVAILSLIAWILSNRKLVQYRNRKIDIWKKTLDVKNLVTDETLLSEAREQWKWDFDVVLQHYMCACNSLNIQASSNCKIMEKVLKEYPPFLTSEVYPRIEFKNGALMYHFVNKSNTRKLSIPITQGDLENPHFTSHDYSGKFYYISRGWDY